MRILSANVVVAAVLTTYSFLAQAESSQERQSRVEQAIAIVKEMCLSGEQFNLRASVDGELQLLRGFGSTGGEVVASVDVRRSKGGVAYFDEQLRAVVDQDVRECMSPHIKTIMDIVNGVTPPPPPHKVGASNLVDPICGAYVVSVSGADVEPIDGINAVLRPANGDCIWGSPGTDLVIDIQPCNATRTGFSRVKVRRSSALVEGRGNFKNFAKVTLYAGREVNDLREIARDTGFGDVNLSTASPIRGASLLRLHVEAERQYKEQLCSIEVL